MASTLDVAPEAVSGFSVQRTADVVAHPPAMEVRSDHDLTAVSKQKGVGNEMQAQGNHVSLAERVLFTRQLGAMVATQITLMQALAILENQTRNKEMRGIIANVRTRIESGSSLAQALARHPKVFNKLYVSMVTCGERAGLLPEILSRLAKHLSNTARLQKKIKSAMLYPAVVVSVAALIAGFLLTYVVPVFSEVFKTFNAPLPAPTQFLITLSNLAKYYLLIVLMAGGAVFYIGWHFINTPFGRYFWDSWRIRLPLVGDLAHKICIARFARTFASLVSSGVPMLEGLQIVSQAAGNVVLEKAIKAIAQDIEGGQTISTALSKHQVFPDMIVRMVACGEETGGVDIMLEQLADFLDEETEVALGGLTSVIEPILIVFLGVTMGGMVICMFLPIFKLPEIISHQ